ncbi:hypothetical protein ACR75P_08430 [Faecalicoccus pleomorphus]|uniref:hypothetical protein n=1 Tax=Faecalicoccus pleomorphus TaxID=1323 RepID=UPI003DA433BE
MKTKVIGKLLQRTIDEDGSMNVTFKVDNWRYRNYLQKLDKKEYSIVLSDVRNSRTLQQNKYLWALIHEISENENAQSNDDIEMYCYLLRMAKAKYTFVSVIEDGLEDLKKEMRYVEVIEYETRPNGKRFANCRVFLGSSKFDTKEMAKLIDTTIEYAENLGIDTAYYREVLQ